ncbi:MAG TPA: hypothetical protein VL026_07460, partial [Rhizomicrobium sp.]|nr:hypothetical protein [Rhizomicrobium sp.]
IIPASAPDSIDPAATALTRIPWEQVILDRPTIGIIGPQPNICPTDQTIFEKISVKRAPGSFY